MRGTQVSPPLSEESVPGVAERHALLEALRQDEQDRARAFASTMRLRAELWAVWGGSGSVVLELSGSARVGQARAATQLRDGMRMVFNYQRALELLEAGRLTQGVVELLLRATARCTDHVQAELGRRVLDQLVELDAADARRLILATVPEVEADLDLAEQERAHAQARADRGVWVKPVEDGMSMIGATVDQITGHRFQLDLEELVRAQKVADERSGIRRTQAQRRADVLAELPTRHLALLRALASGRSDALLQQAREAASEQLSTEVSGSPTHAWDLRQGELVVALLGLPVRAPTVVNVHVPMSTLLELDHRSGHVEGLGPVPASLIRLLVPEAGLRRIAVNGATGLPYGLDPTVHPPVEVSRYAGHGRDPGWPPPDAGPGGPPGGGGPPEPPGPHDPSDPTLPAELERERHLGLLRPLRLRLDAELRHDPSRGLRRHVEVRDLACTGPGCSRAARACDLDHGVTYASGGPTAAWNLFAASRRCHLARHQGWTVTHDLATGTSTWVSPDGSTYTRRSPWRPHAPLTDDLALPLPCLAVLPQPARTFPDHERGLPVRGGDADARARGVRLPWAREQNERVPGGGWNTGPAPF